MTANVITIARTLGAYGEEVGRAVAGRLGYRYVDDDIIHLAADRAGVDAGEIARVEGRRRLVDKVVRALAMGGPMPFDGGAAVALAMYPPGGGLEAVIMDVVVELAAEGRVVLVAHGGGRVLRTQGGVLRCLVTAPTVVRARRVTGGRDAVADSDKARREFFRRFFDDTEHPDDYDLVLSTERLTAEAAAEAVICLANAIP
jgi:cytidylate kinase